MSLALPPLMFITNHKLMGEGPEILDTLRAAVWSLPPRSVLVHIRERELEGRALTELCRAMLPVIRDASQLVVVNDRLDIARYVGADGVHLPSTGLPASDARRLWPSAIIGQACHALDARDPEVDYVTLSPIFATPSKPGVAPQGLAMVKRAALLKTPFYALGGIDANNAASVFAAGAPGVAMMRGAWRPL
jgi:thiamine-phosphate pyrophosphorylase